MVQCRVTGPDWGDWLTLQAQQAKPRPYLKIRWEDDTAGTQCCDVGHMCAEGLLMPGASSGMPRKCICGRSVGVPERLVAQHTANDRSQGYLLGRFRERVHHWATAVCTYTFYAKRMLVKLPPVQRLCNLHTTIMFKIYPGGQGDRGACPAGMVI